MKSFLFATVAALGIAASGSAFAGSQQEGAHVARPIYTMTEIDQGGSQSAPLFVGTPAPVNPVAMLDRGGSQSEPLFASRTGANAQITRMMASAAPAAALTGVAPVAVR